MAQATSQVSFIHIHIRIHIHKHIHKHIHIHKSPHIAALLASPAGVAFPAAHAPASPTVCHASTEAPVEAASARAVTASEEGASEEGASEEGVLEFEGDRSLNERGDDACEGEDGSDLDEEEQLPDEVAAAAAAQGAEEVDVFLPVPEPTDLSD